MSLRMKAFPKNKKWVAMEDEVNEFLAKEDVKIDNIITSDGVVYVFYNITEPYKSMQLGENCCNKGCGGGK